MPFLRKEIKLPIYSKTVPMGWISSSPDAVPSPWALHQHPSQGPLPSAPSSPQRTQPLPCSFPSSTPQHPQLQPPWVLPSNTQDTAQIQSQLLQHPALTCTAVGAEGWAAFVSPGSHVCPLLCPSLFSVQSMCCLQLNHASGSLPPVS